MDTRGLHCLFQGAQIRLTWTRIRCRLLLLSSTLQLETDLGLLIPKARQALARYGHQVVIGNNLHRRKFEVVFVSPISNLKSASPEGLAEYEETWLRIDLNENPEKEIEEDIIAELVKRHEQWIRH